MIRLDSNKWIDFPKKILRKLSDWKTIEWKRHRENKEDMDKWHKCNMALTLRKERKRWNRFFFFFFAVVHCDETDQRQTRDIILRCSFVSFSITNKSSFFGFEFLPTFVQKWSPVVVINQVFMTHRCPLVFGKDHIHHRLNITQELVCNSCHRVNYLFRRKFPFVWVRFRVFLFL